MIATLYDEFKPWSDGGSVWLISDTHFGDADTKLMDPNWPTPEYQVEQINNLVNKNDTLIHLGDVGDSKYMTDIKCRRKILLTGNHDKRSYCDWVFDQIYTGPLFIADRILLSHEPIFGLEAFCLNIHGHDHSGRVHENHINLASNVCGYKPMSLKEIIRSGVMADIPTIHRITIDGAIEFPMRKEEKNETVCN